MAFDSEICDESQRASLRRPILPLVDPELSNDLYLELHKIADSLMRRERADCSIQATILVHDAFMALQTQENLKASKRPQLLAAAATAMRRLLIDHARAKRRHKRGGKYAKKTLPPDTPDVANSFDVLEINEAIDALRHHCPVSAQIVEMKFFGGMSHEEIASALDLSERTVGTRWRFAKSWLYRAMSLSEP